MPTQNPWAWVGMGMGTQCRALMSTPQNGQPNPFNSLEVMLVLKFLFNTNFNDLLCKYLGTSKLSL